MNTLPNYCQLTHRYRATLNGRPSSFISFESAMVIYAAWYLANVTATFIIYYAHLPKSNLEITTTQNAATHECIRATAAGSYVAPLKSVPELRHDARVAMWNDALPFDTTTSQAQYIADGEAANAYALITME